MSKQFNGNVRQIEYLTKSGVCHVILEDDNGNQTFNTRTDDPRVQSVIEAAFARKSPVYGSEDDKTGLIEKIEVNLKYIAGS